LAFHKIPAPDSRHQRGLLLRTFEQSYKYTSNATSIS